MTILTTEVKKSLEREVDICAKTIRFYNKQIKTLEKKYRMSTSSFLRKFEKGEIGDEQDFFDWYAFYKLLTSWTKTRDALYPLIR